MSRSLTKDEKSHDAKFLYTKVDDDGGITIAFEKYRTQHRKKFKLSPSEAKDLFEQLKISLVTREIYYG